ncbi:MAG: NAD(+)/NADH kinase, partial [Bacteroidia bacterium]|nr:NAD(+)/NADH kinase [Bacteroidia bacterium]
ERREEIAGLDYLYCMGGDGTLLEAARFVRDEPILLVGVNMGRLGFLTSVPQEELVERTLDLQAGAWKEDPRTVLTVHANHGEIFGCSPLGINEVSLHKMYGNEMIIIHTYVNGEFMNSYWADGLIIATPSGSTAYNLACGGPIIAPQSGTLVITPIAPHSLTVRPVVLPDFSVITLAVESRARKSMIAIDNLSYIVENDIEISVTKADFPIKLVRFGARGYFATLRSRLNWGVDTRN